MVQYKSIEESPKGNFEVAISRDREFFKLTFSHHARVLAEAITTSTKPPTQSHRKDVAEKSPERSETGSRELSEATEGIVISVSPLLPTRETEAVAMPTREALTSN